MLSLFPRGNGGRRFLALLTLVFVLLGGATRSAASPALPEDALTYAEAPTVSARSAILVNGRTGEVYCGKNAEARLPMASTTKIMTALVAVEALPLDTVVLVPREAVGTEGSSIYLYEGEELTLETLLYALLLESANDAAVAIAHAVSGGIDAFAERMNARACALGLKDTHFENPHGLDSEEHYTTAHDLARITAAALANETLRAIVSTYKRSVPQKEHEGVRLFINHNRLLRSYDGCIGVKTGYTKRSGRCLVSAAERDGLLLVAVTLDAPDDWRDHRVLLDYGFSLYESVALTETGHVSYTLPLLNGVTPTVTVSYRTSDGLPVRVSLPREHGEITETVLLPRHLWGDYACGDTVGSVVYSMDGAVIATLPLTLDTDACGITYTLGIRKRIRALLFGDP